MSEYVATSTDGWGRGFREEDAVVNALNNSRRNSDGNVKVVVWEVDGFESVIPFEVRADEIHSEQTYRIPGDDFQRVKELSLDLDIATEDALAAGME